MKRVILYTSRHGTTRKIALQLAKQLQCETIDLHERPDVSIQHCEMVILGTSIHLGKGDAMMGRFCDHHREALLGKKISLFVTCLLQAESEIQFQKAYPEWLRHHSRQHAIFGGELLIPQMNFLEKLMVKMIQKQKPQTLAFSEAEVTSFGEKLLRIE